MAHVVVRVEMPDEEVSHYGVQSMVDDVTEGLSYDATVTVLEQVGPPGHACCVCGGALHPGLDCRPGYPPDGVEALECCP